MKKSLLTLIMLLGLGYCNAQEMTFVTDKAAGERIQLTVTSEGGFTIEGVEEEAVEGYSGYTLTGTEVKLIGKIKEFSAMYNSISKIDVTDMPMLYTLDVFGNPIADIDLSNNEMLGQLLLGGTNLTELDITHCPNLSYLNINSCKIPSIDFSNSGNLTVLFAKGSGFESLDLTGATSLDVLDCSYNGLSALDLSMVPTVTQLSCAGNNLSSLDISMLKLYVLNCNANKITKLDLSGQKNLEELGCIGNDIETIDFSDCKNLFGAAICSNNIRHEAMTTLCKSLPKVSGAPGYLTVVDLKDADEKNECSVSNVNAVVDKNWEVFDYDGGNPEYMYGVPYEGIPDDQLSIDDISAPAFTVYKALNDSHLYISGVAEGEKIVITDAAGTEIARLSATAGVNILGTDTMPKGIYLVTAGKNTVKVMIN